MRRIFKSINRNKFVLAIGDEGAILTYFSGRKLEQRLFSTVDQADGKKEFADLLASDSEAPIYLLLDVLDQVCTQQSLPAVSSFTIGKLVKKRLERDFAADDIKGALPSGREKTGRKDWLFVFVSAHLAPPLSVWVDFCLEQANPIAGIHMIPVEAETFQKRLNLMMEIEQNTTAKGKIKVKKKHKGKSKAEWQFLVLHNRVSGFRQVVFHNSRIIFSRLIASVAQEPAGVTAGNIEQEILNSMEYLRRLSLPDNAPMDIIICVSDDIKRSFEITEIKNNKLTILTPYEIARKCGLTKAVQPRDQFSDIVFSANFIQHKPLLTLHTKITRQLAALTLLKNSAKYLAIGLVPVMLLIITIRFWQLWDTRQDITKMEKEKLRANQHWEQVQANNVEPAEGSAVITDMVRLYKLLSGGSFSPLTVLASFNSVKGNNVIVKSVNWKVIDPTITPSAEGGQAARAEGGKSTVNINLSIEFYNEGQSIDQFFANFDYFIKRLEIKFAQYDLQYSQLPDKVTVGEVNRMIPVEIKITGPKK